MSSTSSHHKHRKEDGYSRRRSRSRSRSPSDRGHRKERSHRSDKYQDRPDRERPQKDVIIPPKIKKEPADKGYRKYEMPGGAESNARHDDGKVQQKSRNAVARDNTNAQGDDRPVRIKQERDRERNDERRRENRRQRGDANPFRLPAGNAEQGENRDGGEGADETEPPAPKEGPDFGLSGALTEDTNTFRGIVIKYNEPPEARKPKVRWRLYVFKGEQEMPTLYIHRQSAYLLGRERRVADLPIDHPSCSKQHAAIQYRLVEYKKGDGSIGKRVRPYIIDLESANGTFLNNKQIEPKRYYELQEKDVLKFGFSSREYVVLHEKTSADELDDGEL